MEHRRGMGAGVVVKAGAAAVLSAAAGVVAQPAEPLVVDGRLVFPEGAAIPRGMTEAEREWVARHPLGPSTRGITPPPGGPVHCAAEYEAMDGILVAWEGHTALLTQMGRWITTDGDANLYVAVDTTSERTSAQTALTNGGADMGRVQFIVRTTDTVWIRDYGPRYIFEGDCRAIVDHAYNRPRPNDDVFSSFFSTVKGHAFYELPLIHGGGNYHLDALDRSYATRLIVNENPGRTEPEIVGIWHDYQNVDTHLFTPFRTTVDTTQHLDMWMQVIADDAVMVSDFAGGAPAYEDGIVDGAAVFMASRGYTVHRLPAHSVNGVHYTYTNVVMCNDLVLIPMYSNPTVAPSNAVALATWQAALPGKTVRQINCDAIVGLSGVMHCIVMHVPAHRGGANPTAYLRSPNGGETLTPGEQVQVRWISDDDADVTEVDLLLSTDGGATFGTMIAAAIPDSGSFTWTVPDVATTGARVRVVARDGAGNTGHDGSDADFTILGSCAADFDGDGTLTLADFIAFRNAYVAGDLAADFDGSGGLTLADFVAFRNAYVAGCP